MEERSENDLYNEEDVESGKENRITETRKGKNSRKGEIKRECAREEISKDVEKAESVRDGAAR